MLDEVRRFIKREKLLKPREPVRVAVSGGIDSMVLLHVLRALGHACEVVHVDHGLRGAESDADRQFVQEHCEQIGVPFLSARVDVAAHAKAKGVSIQMAARELRYAWFAELWSKAPMPMAQAHHADDAVETLFINLLRGTGVHGWGGIAPISGAYVRPLLGMHRDSIARYAEEHHISFREDASNADPKYLRNRIRHELVPLLNNLRPGASTSIARSIALLREMEQFVPQHVLIPPPGTAKDHLRVPFEKIEGSPSSVLFLHQLLRGMDFHPDVIERIHDAIIERATGAQFAAGNWQACVDRTELIVAPASNGSPSYAIDAMESSGTAGPFTWSLSVEGPSAVPNSMEEIRVDADRLQFPLVLRPWRAGDRMRPMGVGGSKLISDILVDAKVPRIEKPSAYVLEGGGEIIWLVGHRLAEGFQATAVTGRVFQCTFRDQ